MEERGTLDENNNTSYYPKQDHSRPLYKYVMMYQFI